MEHSFTPTIHEILARHFDDEASDIFNSPLIQYLNLKTKSASRDSKSRSSYANIYAIYVLVKDYVDQGFFNSKKDYSKYEGAIFTRLLRQMREMPFGKKLQNHALNHRLNEEFKRYFPTENLPVIRDHATQRYWINENLLKVRRRKNIFNTAVAVLEIIDSYIEAKKNAFRSFVELCRGMQKTSRENPQEIFDYICSLMKPNVDARIFEIVSYSILKQHYSGIPFYWGWSREEISEDSLVLFKTGRTNANDGGIDFVMRPLGRFFQVTETTDVKKYFLDIDKVQRYPITFVIKTDENVEHLRSIIEEKARKEFLVEAVVQKYMECVEEIINIPCLLDYLNETMKKGYIAEMFQEILEQSAVEFNF